MTDPRIAEIKTLTYFSEWYGPVVLVDWGHAVTIQRMDTAKTFSTMVVTKECLKKIDELRGQLPPDEVALAV